MNGPEPADVKSASACTLPVRQQQHAIGSKKTKKKKKKKNRATNDCSNGAPATQWSSVASGGVGGVANKGVDSFEAGPALIGFWRGISRQQQLALTSFPVESLLVLLKDQRKAACSCPVCTRQFAALGAEFTALYEDFVANLGKADAEGAPNDGKGDAKGAPNVGKGNAINVTFDYDNTFRLEGDMLVVNRCFLDDSGELLVNMLSRLATARVRLNDPNAGRSDEMDELLGTDGVSSREDFSAFERHAVGKKMLQLFAAKVIERQIINMYREKVALDNQELLIAEEEEAAQALRIKEEQREAAKLKKKQKRLRQKQTQLEEKRKQQEEEARVLEEQRRQREADEALRELEREKRRQLQAQMEREVQRARHAKAEARRRAAEEAEQKREQEQAELLHKRQTDLCAQQKAAEASSRKNDLKRRKARDSAIKSAEGAAEINRTDHPQEEKSEVESSACVSSSAPITIAAKEQSVTAKSTLSAAPVIEHTRKNGGSRASPLKFAVGSTVILDFPRRDRFNRKEAVVLNVYPDGRLAVRITSEGPAKGKELHVDETKLRHVAASLESNPSSKPESMQSSMLPPTPPSSWSSESTSQRDDTLLSKPSDTSNSVTAARDLDSRPSLDVTKKAWSPTQGRAGIMPHAINSSAILPNTPTMVGSIAPGVDSRDLPTLARTNAFGMADSFAQRQRLDLEAQTQQSGSALQTASHAVLSATSGDGAPEQELWCAGTPVGFPVPLVANHGTNVDFRTTFPDTMFSSHTSTSNGSEQQNHQFVHGGLYDSRFTMQPEQPSKFVNTEGTVPCVGPDAIAAGNIVPQPIGSGRRILGNSTLHDDARPQGPAELLSPTAEETGTAVSGSMGWYTNSGASGEPMLTPPAWAVDNTADPIAVDPWAQTPLAQN